MPSFPSIALDKDVMAVRWLAPLVSEQLNRRYAGLPRGVFVGFEPRVEAGSDILTLDVDDVLGVSKLETLSIGSPVAAVGIFTESNVTLNFQGHTQWPVFVLASSTFATGVATNAKIFTRSSGPVTPTEIVLCKVDKPASDLVVDTSVPTNRMSPVAFTGQEFGWMEGGASGDIVFAQSATAEIVAARDDIKNPGAPPPGQLLADRCAIDFAGDHLADLLALRNITVVGNVKNVPAGATSFNSSGSFAALTREFLPALTIDPGGTESSEGAINAPTDTVRNVVFLVDETTGARLIDSARSPIYGRLEFSTATLTGTLEFENAQVGVTGTGTAFDTELEVGDTILGADGQHYEVESIASPTSLELSLAYQGVDAAGIVSSFRRWTIPLFSRASGSEAGVALPVPANVRPFFSAWYRQDRPIFDATAFMKKIGERPALGTATNAIAGRIKAAIAGGLAGALANLQDSLTTVAQNVHTLNFTGTNAAITDAGGGVANIIVPGEPGPPGPGATPGPVGPDGPPGAGLNAVNPFERSALFGPGGNGHTHTVAFSSATPPLSGTLIHVVGGVARYADDGSAASPWGPERQWRIGSLTKSSNSATIVLDLEFSAVSSATGRVFLGASV